VESGEDRGEGICEKVVRFVPAAPFPWTWHGVAPEIEMRVIGILLELHLGGVFAQIPVPLSPNSGSGLGFQSFDFDVL
jgi:hypothetical protein